MSNTQAELRVVDTCCIGAMPRVVIEDPEPLTPEEGFPFRVEPFPVRNLVDEGVLDGADANPNANAARPENPLRFE